MRGGLITVRSRVWERTALGEHADNPKACAKLILADVVRSKGKH